MELSQKIKEIEDKVVRNELKEALELIQSYIEEDNIDPIRNEVITHLSNLKNLLQLNRSNQIEDDKYLKQRSKISSAILTLKDQYAFYVENPDAMQEEMNNTPPHIVTGNNPVLATAPVQMLHIPNQSIDWFKKALILLFVLFGGASLYFIYLGQMFQTVSTGSMLVATWGAKIYDDNSKFRLQKLLLEQSASAQK